MRYFIFLVCLAISSLAQNTASTNAKDLYTQAMNKLTGTGNSRNDLDGIDLMARSAGLGYVPAQVALGYLYERGVTLTAQPERAAEWYRKAAASGDHLAQYLLGRLYLLGLINGGPKASESWLESAASAGNPFAGYMLGLAVYDRDPAAGIKWFRVGAEQGLPYSQSRLGKALLEGRAGGVNQREAYLWLFAAHENGLVGTETDLIEIEGTLGLSEIEKLKSEARDLQAKTRRSVVAKGCTGWTGELDATPAPPPLDIQKYCE